MGVHLRILFVVILGVMFFPFRSMAQEDYVGTATTALQDVLSHLKQSVQKLSLDNDQLAARDDTMKQQVLQLQAQLGRLESQGDFLNKAVVQLQDKNPRQSQQITRLEKENFDLDNNAEKTQAGIKVMQQSLEAGYQENQKLNLQLSRMTNGLSQDLSPESPTAARRQKEKLKLMKMIYDSQQRQEMLHKAIQGFQKDTPLMPAANALARQQFLKQQVKDLEVQVAAYPSDKPSTNSGLADQTVQLRQLESALKSLEKNYLQLKDLMEQMSKKAKASQMTVSQHIEEEKLRGNIDDLNRQGAGLRGDLDNLRSQMVNLDKRKSRLETMIQHLP